MIAGLCFTAAALTVLGLSLLVPPDERRRSRRDANRVRDRAWPKSLDALAALGASLARRAAPTDTRRRIDAAGLRGRIAPGQLMAAKVGAAVAAFVPGTLGGTIAPGRLGLLVIVVAPIAGFMAPDVWLARRAAERARAVRAQLPELLDLLRVTVDAGASLPSALASVGERAQGPLAAEWRIVAREVALGVPLVEAIGEMEARMPLPEIGALARALERTRRHGVPLGATLAAQAADARQALARRVHEDAARAAPKIQLVVALLLVPSVLLLVAAALIAALAGSGGAGLEAW